MNCPECDHVHQTGRKCEFPVWTTLPKHGLAGNRPCQCKWTPELKWGILFNLTSFWIGVHYSKRELRTCINLIPCCTIWVTRKGGHLP